MVKTNVNIIRHSKELYNQFEESLSSLNVLDKIKPDQNVYIKANLTFPIFVKGVTVTENVLEILIRILLKRSGNIFIVESPGGYGAHTTRDAFLGHKYDGLSRKYNISCVELDKGSMEYLEIDKKLSIPIPKRLLEKNSHFITVAVPKVHAMTGISLCVKNQWGCIPDPMRIKYHYRFNEIILKVNQTLNPLISIIDGTYGLTSSGPIQGVGFSFGCSLISDNVYAADKIMRYIMGWGKRKVDHLDYIETMGLVPENINVNADLENLLSRRFYLKRNFWNYGALWAFHSKRITQLFYLSKIADILHNIMYTFRHKLDIPTFSQKN